MGEIPNYYRNTGESGVPVTGRICKPPGGTSGNDDPNQQGRVFAGLSDMSPMRGQLSPSPGMINQPGPTQMIGKTYHQDWLDEMTCYGRRFPGGFIVWDGCHCQWDGPATPVGTKSGAPGEGTYPSQGQMGKGK